MNDVKFSRYLSYILRHHPEEANVKLDDDGFCDVKTLINNVDKKYKGITLEYLQKIVEEDNKGRYMFNEDMTMIRANQGHSVGSIKFDEVKPPDVLYHGTAKKNLESIKTKGILKGTRHHVHLSRDIETASSVGKRHGELVILKINSKKMAEDKIKFYISKNGVFLCDYIAPEYFEVIEGDK